MFWYVYVVKFAECEKGQFVSFRFSVEVALIACWNKCYMVNFWVYQVPVMKPSREPFSDIIFYEQKSTVSAAEYHRRLCARLAAYVISLRIVISGAEMSRLKMLLAVEDALLCMAMICAKHFKIIIVLQVDSLVQS